MCWYVRTDSESETVCVVNQHTGAEVQCWPQSAQNLARANSLVTAMVTEAGLAEERAKTFVDQTHEFLEALDTLRGMINSFGEIAATTSKAHTQTAGKLLEGKIHEAFTVAADQLFMRGYLERDDRIALSGVIGDMLGSFVKQSEGIDGAKVVVDSADVVAIASKAVSSNPNVDHAYSSRQSFQVVNKEAETPRWVLVSSCNYQDRDGQVVSEASLRKAVMIGDLIGARGPLRWWHTKEKGKVLDLGECDFQMVYKGFLIESGTFVSKAVAAAIGKVAGGLRASIGFIHPDTEPDSDGVFHNIAILERSLLPRGAESNPFTTLVLA